MSPLPGAELPRRRVQCFNQKVINRRGLWLLTSLVQYSSKLKEDNSYLPTSPNSTENI